jgi:hypothetical protein
MPVRDEESGEARERLQTLVEKYGLRPLRTSGIPWPENFDGWLLQDAIQFLIDHAKGSQPEPVPDETDPALEKRRRTLEQAEPETGAVVRDSNSAIDLAEAFGIKPGMFCFVVADGRPTPFEGRVVRLIQCGPYYPVPTACMQWVGAARGLLADEVPAASLRPVPTGETIHGAVKRDTV